MLGGWSTFSINMTQNDLPRLRLLQQLALVLKPLQQATDWCVTRYKAEKTRQNPGRHPAMALEIEVALLSGRLAVLLAKPERTVSRLQLEAQQKLEIRVDQLFAHGSRLEGTQTARLHAARSAWACPAASRTCRSSRPRGRHLRLSWMTVLWLPGVTNSTAATAGPGRRGFKAFGKSRRQACPLPLCCEMVPLWPGATRTTAAMPAPWERSYQLRYARSRPPAALSQRYLRMVPWCLGCFLVGL